jgi:hypothetical protein
VAHEAHRGGVGKTTKPGIKMEGHQA